MRNILSEFEGSMARINNNYYFSFLSLNFINQRPFFNEIVLPVSMENNRITAASVNSFDADGIQEFANSIRRHFLNDIVIAYERYAQHMLASHENSQNRTDPCLRTDRRPATRRLEQLANVFTQDDMRFLEQLRRFRNSIVHYNGVYNFSNELNYTFGQQTYVSSGSEGQHITAHYDTLRWIYSKLLEVVRSGDSSYYSNYLAS